MMEALLMMMMKALAPVLVLMMALAPVEVMMQQRALLDQKSKWALLLMQKWEPVQERQLEALLPDGQDPVQCLQLEVLPQRMFLQQETHLQSWALALRLMEVFVDENLKSTELEEKSVMSRRNSSETRAPIPLVRRFAGRSLTLV